MLIQKKLKELLHYNKETGVFTRRKWVNGTGQKKGDVVGSYKSGGYLQCKISGKLYMMHRLAFLYVEGYFPEHCVDHLNGVCDDNRWCNLRHATISCNMQNKAIGKNNKTGFVGVSVNSASGKFSAEIKDIRIGVFETPESAALARCEYEKSLDGWNCNDRGVNFKKLRSMGYDI